MSDNDDQRNEQEYNDRIDAILSDPAATIGVRDADGRPWPDVESRSPEQGDPPTALLYDKNRLVVREDALPVLAHFLPGLDAADEYPGFDRLSIVDVSAFSSRGDAYKLMTDFFGEHPELEPDPAPIGQYDPFMRHRELDSVSLIRHYLSASHVFFWPESSKRPPNGPLEPAPYGDSRVVVVIDTGINPDHDFLRAGPGASYLRDATSDAEWSGGGIAEGHGTGVAAVVRQHNGQATIVGARARLGQGRVNTVEETEIIAAIDVVMTKFGNPAQPVVLNLSFGGPVLYTSALYVKLQQFVGPNRRVVAAAGNVTGPDYRRPMQPAAWPIVYAVASHDENGDINSWSNGDTDRCVWVDAMRNGEVDTADGSSNGAVVRWRGTSFAAPQVAATI